MSDTARADEAVLPELMRRSFAQSEAVIRAVEPDQMEGRTPCALFDVRTLVGHMLFAATRVAAVGRREPAPEDGPAVTGLDDGDWAPTLAKVAAEAVEAWRSPGAMEGEIVLPFGTFPATFVAKMYIVEQTAHAWDLAVATGNRSLLDTDLAETVLPIAREIIPAEYRGEEPMPFAAEVGAAPDAPVLDRLAAFMGRDPSAWPDR